MKNPSSILLRHQCQIRLNLKPLSNPCHRRQSSIRLTLPTPQSLIRSRRIHSPSSTHLPSSIHFQNPNQIRKNPIRSQRWIRFQQSRCHSQNRSRFRQNPIRCQCPIRWRRSFRCSPIPIDSHRSSMRYLYQTQDHGRG
jgi:hypothetical protein